MDPAVRRDREHVAALLTDDFRGVRFFGAGVDARFNSRTVVGNGDLYAAPAVEDFACRMLGEDVALATYRSVRNESDGRTHCHVAEFNLDKEVGELENVLPSGNARS